MDALAIEDSSSLKTFWVFQHLRTEAIQRSILGMSREMENALGQPHPKLTILPKEATLTALSAFANNPDAIADLALVLIENRSAVPFITSDNPAVQSNRWSFTERNSDIANFGLHSAGFIGLLPVSPELLVLMYDKDIYSMQHNNGRVLVRSDNDIHLLNEHQLLGCFANVYMAGDFSSHQRGQISHIREMRSKSGPRVRVFAKRNGTDDPRYYAAKEIDTSISGEALFVTSTYFARPTAWPSFLGWRPSGFYFANGSGVGQVRRAKVQFHGRPFEKFRTRR